MEDFNTLVERYMQCDKRTLAELLALKELCWYPRIQDPPRPYQPYIFPPQPYQPWAVPNDYPPSPWVVNDTLTTPIQS